MQDTRLPPGCTQADIDRAATSRRGPTFYELSHNKQARLEIAFQEFLDLDLLDSCVGIMTGDDEFRDSRERFLLDDLLGQAKRFLEQRNLL